MTIAKASLLAIGFIGAVALGVAIGPSLTQRETAVIAPPAAEIAQPAATPASKPLTRAPRTPRRQEAWQGLLRSQLRRRSCTRG